MINVIEKNRTVDERIGRFEWAMVAAGVMNKTEVWGVEEWLINNGFFTAPASLNHHGMNEGDLFEHSFSVMSQLIQLTVRNELQWQNNRSPYIVGMLHDVCKMDNYILEEKLHPEDNNKTFMWNNSQLLGGHGDKSVIMLAPYINLTEEEIMCIRWHMGAFDSDNNWKYYSKAVSTYPNVLFTHTADVISSQILGI